MKTKLKQNKAITLIALIITVIVMLILVGVVISVVINSNLLGTAQDATARTKTAYEEEAKYGDKITVDGKRYANINDYLNNVEMICKHEDIEIVEATCEETGKKICKLCGHEESILTEPALGHNFVNGFGECTNCHRYTSPFIGCYVDIDPDIEGVDGIIFADLAYPTSGTYWSITYSYPAQNLTFKTYRVIGEKTKKFEFEENNVLEVDNSNGEPRFYVMALDEVKGNRYWYKNAYTNMIDYSTYTSTDFGSGPENTIKMLRKWNGNGLIQDDISDTINYGLQNSSDMWKVVEEKRQSNPNSNWFVPSRDEWVAYFKTFGITSANSTGFGKNSETWTSSQKDAKKAWTARCSHNDMNYWDVDYYYCWVRFAACF